MHPDNLAPLLHNLRELLGAHRTNEPIAACHKLARTTGDSASDLIDLAHGAALSGWVGDDPREAMAYLRRKRLGLAPQPEPGKD